MKRLPEVPPAVGSLGVIVSKATLLEVAYSFALRLQGEEDERQAVHILVTEIEILTGKKIPLPSSACGADLRAILEDRKGA